MPCYEEDEDGSYSTSRQTRLDEERARRIEAEAQRRREEQRRRQEEQARRAEEEVRRRMDRELNQRQRDLEVQREHLSREADRTQREARELRAERSEIESLRRDLQRSEEEDNRKEVAKRGEFDQRDRELTKLRNDLDERVKAVGNLETRRTDLDRREATFRSQAAQIERDARQLKRDKEELEMQLAQIRSELERKKKNLDRRKEGVEAQEKQLAEREIEISRQREQLKKRGSELDAKERVLDERQREQEAEKRKQLEDVQAKAARLDAVYQAATYDEIIRWRQEEYQRLAGAVKEVRVLIDGGELPKAHVLIESTLGELDRIQEQASADQQLEETRKQAVEILIVGLHEAGFQNIKPNLDDENDPRSQVHIYGELPSGKSIVFSLSHDGKTDIRQQGVSGHDECHDIEDMIKKVTERYGLTFEGGIQVTHKDRHVAGPHSRSTTRTTKRRTAW